MLREYGVSDALVRDIRSFYDWCQILVCIAGSKSDSFPVRVGLDQSCPLSLVLLITFIGRIVRCNRGNEGIQFGDLIITSLFITDDVVPLASLSRDLQLSLEWFSVDLEVVEMKISTSKSEAIFLSRKSCELPSLGQD